MDGARDAAGSAVAEECGVTEHSHMRFRPKGGEWSPCPEDCPAAQRCDSTHPTSGDLCGKVAGHDGYHWHVTSTSTQVWGIR